MEVRKSLAEALVLSKLNYCNVEYAQMPIYLINKLQQFQNATAGYVFGRYVTMQDITNVHWLPIKENIKFSTIKLVLQSLHSKLWSKYFLVEPAERRRNLLSSERKLKSRMRRKTILKSDSHLPKKLCYLLD